MSKKYIGIEIGTTQIKLAEVADGAIKRTALGDVPTDLVRDGAVVSPEAMAEVIRKTVKSGHISGRACALVLPSSLAYTRMVTMPYMTTQQLELNLPYEFRDYITQEKDKYFYDYALESVTEGEDGKVMELLAAAVLKSTIREYSDMLRRAGLSLKLAMPQECAFRNLLLSAKKEDSVERCFVDLGHSSTKLFVYSGARFQVSRALDLGGESMTDVIAEVMHVDRHLAETYKKTNFEGIHGHEDVLAICSRIATEIKRAMHFYSFSSGGRAVSEIYFCGGGREMSVLTDAITAELDIPAMPVSALLPGAHESDASLCVFAAGAALQPTA